MVLSAIGVVANLEGVLAPTLKPELDRNYLQVGDDYQTSIKGIYGAGDIIGPPWLAHVATFEAVNAVNGMFGHGKPRRVKNFPGCTYCQPQVASMGLTEKAAREKGLDVKVGKFPFTASGKAVASAETEGFVKVVTRRQDRGDLRRPHHRLRGHGADRRVRPRDRAGGHRRGDPPDDPRPPDAERGRDGGGRGHPGRGDPHLIGLRPAAGPPGGRPRSRLPRPRGRGCYGGAWPGTGAGPMTTVHHAPPVNVHKLARMTLFGFILTFIAARACVFMIMAKAVPNLYFFLRERTSTT